MRRTFGWIGGALALVVVLVLSHAYLFYPAEYVTRVLTLGDADIGDVEVFPGRRVAAPLEARDLPRGSGPIDASFASLGRGDLDAFLEETDSRAFLVIRDGSLLAERYVLGADEVTVLTSFSVAKSFGSVVVAHLVGEGLLDFDDPITTHLPELAARPGFEDITIAHLLDMSSGIAYSEFPWVTGDDAKTYYFPDLRALALEETDVVGTPGAVMHYNNYHPLLLGMIIERVTGTSVSDVLAEVVWQPMGAEEDGSWSLDERGFEKMESGINGIARDFGRFGLFMLDALEGEGVLPEEYVDAIAVPYRLGDADYYEQWMVDTEVTYTLMWWQATGEGFTDLVAFGNHGQLIYVAPRSGVVVVRLGASYGIPFDEWIPLLREFVSALD